MCSDLASPFLALLIEMGVAEYACPRVGCARIASISSSERPLSSVPGSSRQRSCEGFGIAVTHRWGQLAAESGGALGLAGGDDLCCVDPGRFTER